MDSIKDFATKNNVDILLLQETFIDNITFAKLVEQNFELNERHYENKPIQTYRKFHLQKK